MVIAITKPLRPHILTAHPEGLMKTHKKAPAEYHAGLSGVFHTDAFARVVTEDITDRGEARRNRKRYQVNKRSSRPSERHSLLHGY